MDRNVIAQSGREARSRLFPRECDKPDPIPDFSPISDEIDFGMIRSRDVLPDDEKLLVGLTASCLLQRMEIFADTVRAACAAGISPRGVLEVIVQCSLYTGFTIIEPTAKVAKKVFAEEGLEVDSTELEHINYEAMSAIAKDMMSDLHGTRKTSDYASPTRAFSSRLYPIGSTFGYGMLWQRPGLTLRQRLIIAITSGSAMTALGSVGTSFRKFSYSAVENAGFTVDEVAEIVLQSVPYCGFWVANSAMEALEEIFPGGKFPGDS